jgi:putative tryptophan/tyrosine transport system substrate-binding protein
MRTSRLALMLAALFGLVAAGLAAEAQQVGKVYRLGYLSSHSPETFRIHVFKQALHDSGWVEGKNIVIDYRSADGKLDRLPALAADLVGLNVDVIVAVPTVSALAAKRATSKIPVVFTHVSDPVGTGLVTSLARPGGNITGFTHLNASLNPKRLEILKEAAPQATRLAALWQPGGLGERTERVMLTETEAAARALGLSLQLLEARGSQDLDRVFAAMAKDRAAALIVLPGPVLLTEHRRVVELAAKIRQPAMYFAREFAEAGGLMAYGANMADILRGAASYVDKILKGTEPANLPVVQGSKFELVINLKAANAVGLTIPASLLARADEILQ